MILPALLLALVPAASAQDARRAADAHFLAGYDHFRAARPEDARREWKACLALDEKNDFCEFGLTALDAAAPPPLDGTVPAPLPAPERRGETVPSVTDAPPSPDRDAQQQYLEGIIYYQKGDYEKARDRWAKARRLATPGSEAHRDATAGLEKLAKLLGDAPAVDDQTSARGLKTAEEPKDEHLALQVYFTGMIHYQKGDLARARVEWKRALALSPKGSSVESDAKAALKKLDQDEASTRRDGKK
jgi:tetratricopeptide (TPR) repeat protein